jgi:hypothetical protein
MRIIDNVNELLGDDLKAAITLGSKVRIAASTFSIFAFEALRKELEQVSEAGCVRTDIASGDRRERPAPPSPRCTPGAAGQHGAHPGRPRPALAAPPARPAHPGP